MKGKVTDRDQGADALMKRLKEARALSLSVGVHGSEGAAPEGKLTVADIATIHEFGLGHNPERSFIRAWADERKADHMAAIRAVGLEVLKGTYTAVIGLERLGALFVGEVQARISAGIAPPLKIQTANRKGSSVPLVNTGQLKSSIRSRVEKGS